MVALVGGPVGGAVDRARGGKPSALAAEARAGSAATTNWPGGPSTVKRPFHQSRWVRAWNVGWSGSTLGTR